MNLRDSLSWSVRIVVIGIVLASSASPGTYVHAQSPDPATFWNQFTTQLSQAAKLNPVRLARAYGLVHVAIYDSLLASSAQFTGVTLEVAVAAGAASVVLVYLFPANTTLIQTTEASQISSPEARSPGLATRVVAALSFGQTVGSFVVAYAQNDGSSAVFTGPIPTGDCIWTGVKPLEPLAGTWKTWIVTSGAEFQPEVPYPCGSPADLADVQAVIDAHNSLTAEQIAIVHKWADVLAPTIWNNLLSKQIAEEGVSILESARAYTYLNIAVYDGLVATWLAKYTYWTARPFQRIPGFVPVIKTPNFPSYISAHSTVSGAASVVMGALFPDLAAYFAGQADEAAMSRLWGGIHYPHDNEQGLIVGREIGGKAVADMMGEPHTFVFPMNVPATTS